jgi:hypothetical protein
VATHSWATFASRKGKVITNDTRARETLFSFHRKRIIAKIMALHANR